MESGAGARDGAEGTGVGRGVSMNARRIRNWSLAQPTPDDLKVFDGPPASIQPRELLESARIDWRRDWDAVLVGVVIGFLFGVMW